MEDAAQSVTVPASASDRTGRNEPDAPKAVPVEALWKMPEVELLATYHDARRRYAEAKFARDSQRARLEWLRAKAYAATTGAITEPRNGSEASEELERKGQEEGEMPR